MKFSHRFVRSVPEVLEDNVVYVSLDYATAIHKCACGCGMEVVTPFSPTDWKLVFDGKAVSIYPSIGNWGFPCQSHYWISSDAIVWASKWSDKEIKRARAFSGYGSEPLQDRGLVSFLRKLSRRKSG